MSIDTIKKIRTSHILYTGVFLFVGYRIRPPTGETESFLTLNLIKEVFQLTVAGVQEWRGQYISGLSIVSKNRCYSWFVL